MRIQIQNLFFALTCVGFLAMPVVAEAQQAVLLNQLGPLPSLGIALTTSFNLTTNASGIFNTACTAYEGANIASFVAFTNVDGRVDVAGVDDHSELVILTNNGSGVFATNTITNFSYRPWGITAADVNGDGKVDLIYAGSYVIGGYSGNGTLTVATNDGNGSFVYSATYLVGNYPAQLLTTDVNNDGHPDLVCAITDLYGQASILVLTNNGNGGFATNTTINAGAPFGFGRSSVTTADVNNDGWVDLVCASPGGGDFNGTLLVFTNNHRGGFVRASEPVVGIGPVSVAAADVNNDGWVDLITANEGSGFGDDTLTVLTNDQRGGFALASTPVPGNGVNLVVAADVNGDGWLDLIAANEYDSTLSVLTNDHSGGFELATNIPVAGGAGLVLAEDVNRDGLVDLLTTGGDTLSVFTNGSAVLAQAVHRVVVSWPSPSTGFTLEQTTNLNTGIWATNNNAVSDDGTNRSISISAPTGNLFFRLGHP